MKPMSSELRNERNERSSRFVQRGFAAAATLLLFIGSLSGCHQDPNIVKQKYLESGERHMADRQYQQAAIQFLNAIKIDRNFAEAHYELAQAYLNVGDFWGAYTELEKTVDLQPANFPARIQLGKLLLAGGKADEAQFQIDYVLKARPDNPDAHAMLSALALKADQRDRALQEIRRAIALAPSRPDFHQNLALILSGDSTQLSVAEAELKKAAALDPRSAQAYILLADFYSQFSRPAEAEQAARNAIAADPKNMTARKTLAKVYFQEGNDTAAEQVLRQASEDFASDPDGVQMLADYYNTTGQFQRAKDEYKRLMGKLPSNMAVQEGYIRALLNTNDIATARSVISELLKKHGKDPNVVALNAILLIQDGKTNEAVSDLQAAVRDTPDDAFLQFWLGKAQLANGDPDGAERSFLESSRLDPNNVDTQNVLAELGVERGDSSLVASEADHMISTAPHYAVGYIWRAIMEMRDNTYDRAEADLKTAISIAPNDAAGYVQMGKLLFMEKRNTDAVASLEHALQLDPDYVEAVHLIMAYDADQKQPEKALARLQAQMKIRPQNSGYYDLLADWYINAKQPNSGADAAEKAIQLNPEDAQAVLLYVQSEVAAGQIPSAIEAWHQWINDHPRDAMAVALVGTLEESRGNIPDAEDLYRKALQMQERQPVAANNLAYIMLERGENVDVALTLAQIARQSLPESPETADTLAWAYYRKGIYRFAYDLLDTAVRTEPDNASFQYHLGMVCMKLNDRREADLHLHRAQTLAPNTSVGQQAADALKGIRNLAGM